MFIDLGILETRIQMAEQKAQDWYEDFLWNQDGEDDPDMAYERWLENQGEPETDWYLLPACWQKTSRPDSVETTDTPFYTSTRENLYARQLEGGLDPDYM